MSCASPANSDQVAKAAAVLDQMQRKLRRQDWLSTEDVGNAIRQAVRTEQQRAADEIDVYAKGHAIKPKTDGPEAIHRRDPEPRPDVLRRPGRNRQDVSRRRRRR